MTAKVLGSFCCRGCRIDYLLGRGIEWRAEDLYPFFVFHLASHMGDE